MTNQVYLLEVLYDESTNQASVFMLRDGRANVIMATNDHGEFLDYIYDRSNILRFLEEERKNKDYNQSNNSDPSMI